jgi:mannose-1-phosphate guanylyltransferase
MRSSLRVKRGMSILERMMLIFRLATRRLAKNMFNPEKVVAVVLAGGRGERFWPRSRRATPKQLLNITSERPLVLETWDRIKHITPNERIILVSDPRLTTSLVRVLPDLLPDNVIVEPEGRNTAASVALAASVVKERWGNDALMMVLPSDHYISNVQAFAKAVNAALTVAAEGCDLVTLGMRPTRPETGYGYIEIPSEARDVDGQHVYRVIRFTEKPGMHQAIMFLQGGMHLWNSGMFFWRVDVIWSALEQHFPAATNALVNLPCNDGENRSRILAQNYSCIPREPIDRAVMEKASNISVVDAYFPWDDVGNWESLERIKEPDNERNIVVSGEHVSIDTYNCIINSTGPLVATIGVNDLIIVAEKDAILVFPKGRGEEVKKIVEKLGEMGDKRNLL